MQIDWSCQAFLHKILWWYIINYDKKLMVDMSALQWNSFHGPDTIKLPQGTSVSGNCGIYGHDLVVDDDRSIVY